MGHPSSSSSLDNFPQPTRPNFIHEMDLKPLFPEGFAGDYHHPNALELPQPSRPVASEPEIPTCRPEAPLGYVQFSETIEVYPAGSMASSLSEEKAQFSPATGKTPKGEKEAVDELLLILVECMEELNTRSREGLLRKFFSEIEKDERLERFIVDRLKQSRVRAISELCQQIPLSVRDRVDSPSVKAESSVQTRSLGESMEELSHKLERFKVKIPDLGGEVEEDKKPVSSSSLSLI